MRLHPAIPVKTFAGVEKFYRRCNSRDNSSENDCEAIQEIWECYFVRLCWVAGGRGNVEIFWLYSELYVILGLYNNLFDVLHN